MSRKTKAYTLAKPFRQGSTLLEEGDEIQLTEYQASAFSDFIEQPKSASKAKKAKEDEKDEKKAGPPDSGKASGPPI